MYATPRTRMPLALYHSIIPMISLIFFSSRGCISRFSSRYAEEMPSISGIAPLVIIMSTSSPRPTTTVALLLSKSKGTSPTDWYASTSSESRNSSAYSWRAQSIWLVADLRFLALRAEYSSTVWLELPYRSLQSLTDMRF